MKKIPTVFKRNPDNMTHVLPEVNPGCEWVLNGEGVMTRKYDGTCVMKDDYGWWARREVKPGRTAPVGFVLIDYDPITEKSVGWEPIEQSVFFRVWLEVLTWRRTDSELSAGTYELIGPKINKNPEGYVYPDLIKHETAEVLTAPEDFEFTYENLRFFMLSDISLQGFEGIVWHHPDGHMAKLKVKDFPKEPEGACLAG